METLYPFLEPTRTEQLVQLLVQRNNGLPLTGFEQLVWFPAHRNHGLPLTGFEPMQLAILASLILLPLYHEFQLK